MAQHISPSLFPRPRDADEYLFKANGKMFRDVYPVTREET
jgi:hypothetical protein